MVNQPLAVGTPAPSGSRLISAAEFLIGAAVVIGHNVFRVVPNEVPILTALGLLSARLRNGGLSALGFRRPTSWTRILLIAVAAAAVRLLVDDLVITPFFERFWPPERLPAEVDEITGNLKLAGFYLLVIWTFAAFGEEIAYRGYLLRRAADIGRLSTAAYLIGVVLVAILFGYGHYYKGPVGIVSSGFAGLVLGIAFLVAGRNLWACVLAHGFIDTFGLLMAFFGWAD